MFDHRKESQGKILAEIARLVEAGKLKTTVGTVLHGLTAENLKQAHTKLESNKSVGKIVIDL